jgi:heptosyltransferase-3
MSIGFPNRIAIARTDSIGDVMVTLPLCGYIKKKSPQTHVIFIGRSYTQAIAEACSYIDEFINFDLKDQFTLNADAVVFAYPDKHVMQWVKTQPVPIRIATARRVQSWLYANNRIWFSRKNSDLHESQLNFHLLKPFGVNTIPTMKELVELQTLNTKTNNPISIDPNKHSVIFHMLSKGSAKNWPMSQFAKLAELLEKHNCHIYLTGTEQEGNKIKSEFPLNNNITDLTGTLSLPELIAFIQSCDCLIAASTGPLHIAAACNINAIGLYPITKPMHAGRWAPIGKKVSIIEDSSSSDQQLEIQVKTVFDKIIEVLKLAPPSE